METSDSEYFESADEDFLSDDELEVQQKQDVKQNIDTNIREKTEKLSITKIETTDSTKSVIEKEKKNLDNKCRDKTVENDDKRNTKMDKVSLLQTECSEPGTAYAYDNNKEKSENNVQNPSERPEHNIPPTRVGGCSFPNNKNRTNDNIEQSDSINSRPKFQVPPAVSSSGLASDEDYKMLKEGSVLQGNLEESSSSQKNNEENQLKEPNIAICSTGTTILEPGITTKDRNKSSEPHSAYLDLVEKQKNDAEGNVKNKVIQKPKRPEFGIPPARTTCWVPGVTNTRDVGETFEPHPAYLKLMEERKQEAQQNMWDDEDWGDFDIQVEKIMIKPNDEKLDPKMGIKETEENMWEDDDWEPIESNVQHDNAQKSKVSEQSKNEERSWGDWSSWGLSSVISTATNFTSQVSQGITNVLETGIGAPDPEELAKINKMEKEKIKQLTSTSHEELPPEKPVLSFGLGNLVHGVTKLVETTGTKVISGGLDTLETIGKKTMEVLQENDPGLKKKRAFLKLDDNKPILSQVLREAKEKAEKENKELEKKHFAKKANYETLFDDHQGLVHLEALEMLSKQCDIKLQSLLESTSGDALNDMQETLDQVKELCELPEEDDEETLSTDEIKEKLESAVSEINVKINYNKLLTTWQEVEDWLVKLNLQVCSINELHQQAIESLAQLTALAVEQFHKAGELLLIKDHRSTADEADSLVQLTTTLTALIGIIAAKFSEKLNMIVAEGANKEEVNSLITNVFFEAANSSSYIEDAFQLLIPVLQVGAV